MAKKVDVTKERLQEAWDIIADFMNQQKEISFFIDPWTERRSPKYNLYFLDDDGKMTKVVTAKRGWKK
jgi:hypothetical protein